MLKFYKILYRPCTTSKLKLKNIQRIRPYNELPYAVINTKIPFNKYGLYLLGEVKHRKYEFMMIILGGVIFLNTILLGVVLCSTVYIFQNLCLLANSLYVFRKLKNKPSFGVLSKISSSMITRIYLSENLKDVVVQFVQPGKYMVFDIKSFYIVNKQTFDKHNNQIAFPIGHQKRNDYQPMFIPLDLFVYDKELFCAIFRGYPMRTSIDEENVDQYILEVENKDNPKH